MSDGSQIAVDFVLVPLSDLELGQRGIAQSWDRAVAPPRVTVTLTADQIGAGGKLTLPAQLPERMLEALRGGIREAFAGTVDPMTPAELAEAEADRALPPPEKAVWVDGPIARQAAERGQLVGRCEATPESKGTAWAVYFFEGKIYACVESSHTGGISCGEIIDPRRLALYVDLPRAARAAYDRAKAAAAGGGAP